MNQSEQRKNQKIMLAIVGIAILVIGLVGVTYAFFNYTRTGTANVIKTGRISFNSEQGTAINLTNMFPIDVSGGIPNDNTKVGTVTLNVTGDTTYDGGIEYLVSAVNVQNTIGSGQNEKKLPISIDVSVANNTTNNPSTTLGTSDDSYFDNRGGNSSIYKVLSNETINNNDQLLVGYITKGATGIDGNIVIKAYLDKAKVAITDTYDGTESDNMGTTTTWVNDRVTFTTGEWNSLQQDGISFQVKVEANEGVWVQIPQVTINYIANGGTVNPSSKQIAQSSNTYGELATPTPPSGYSFSGWFTQQDGGTQVTSSTNYVHGTSPTTLYAHWKEIPIVSSCPNCRFIYTTNTYNYGQNGDLLSDITELYSYDYNDIITSDRQYFIGFTESNGRIDMAYACGIKSEEPNNGAVICIDGDINSSYSDKVQYMTNMWGSNKCHNPDDASFECSSSVGSSCPLGAGATSITISDIGGASSSFWCSNRHGCDVVDNEWWGSNSYFKCY